MRKGTVLIIDDEEEIGILIKQILEKNNINSSYVTTGQDGLNMLEKQTFNVVLIDFRLPDISGIELFNKIKKEKSVDNTAIILMTAYGDTDMGIKAIKLGFDDYIAKPFNLENLLFRITKEIETVKLKERVSMLSQPFLLGFDDIIGKSKKMQNIYCIIKKISPKDTTVLIEGETGTGKELVAKAIHRNSKRKNNIFMPVNSGALTETLLESELFGHEKGAFTGANSLKYGILNTAHKGTVFLDEINTASLNLQVKLLRFIETGEFFRVGGNNINYSDTRIIAATNKNLLDLVKENKFREDLYYRLNVVKIVLPPLRKRKDDIPLLVDYFISMYNKKFDKKVKISSNAINLFLDYHWPGNIRELKNIMHSLVLMNDDGIITEKDLPEHIVKDKFFIDNNIKFKEMKKKVIEDFEINYFRNILSKTKGNVSAAARILDINRKNFIEKLKFYSIEPKEFKK